MKPYTQMKLKVTQALNLKHLIMQSSQIFQTKIAYSTQMVLKARIFPKGLIVGPLPKCMELSNNRRIILVQNKKEYLVINQSLRL